MRRIRLYIGGKEADLSNESLVLMNYTAEELANPTIVKNTYSQRIELEGTEANNAIFGNIWKSDRVTMPSSSATGVGFDATHKTPFVILDDMSNLLESGYVKLEEVTHQGKAVKYSISLFGGLGSLFYALSYTEEGTKRTLADLDYLTGGEDELSFKINADNVKEAWAHILTPKPSDNPLWSVINFGACYNGIPDKDFSPDKGLIDPAECGLPARQGEYSTRGGYCMVNLDKPKDEWAVKDLRSYLQRPLLSMRAFFDAIAKPENNGGFTIDVSEAVNPATLGKWSDLWLTLPMIQQSKALQQDSGTLTAKYRPSHLNDVLGAWDVTGLDLLPSGTKVEGAFTIGVNGSFPNATSDILFPSVQAGRNVTHHCAMFFQVLAYDSTSQARVGGSRVQFVGSLGGLNTALELANTIGYKPKWVADDIWLDTPRQDVVWEKVLGTIDEYRLSAPVRFNTSQVRGATIYSIQISTYFFRNYWGTIDRVQVLGNNNFFGFAPNNKNAIQSTGKGTFSQEAVLTYPTQTNARSNAVVTKKALLSSSATPADYLLSFCKLFGLYILYDKTNKSARIVNRNTLFTGRLIDIDGLVDRRTEWKVRPFMFDSKWYEMTLKGWDGDFEKAYKDTEGREYGNQRINTNYDFDSKTKQLLDKVVFKNAVPSREHGSYFNTLTKTGIFYPSPFLDLGNTYTLWRDSNLESEDYNIPTPPSDVNIEYFNPSNHGYDYDFVARLQFHDKTNKPLDGSNVLGFFGVATRYPDFTLSDDLPLMDAVNEGKPCWILSRGEGVDVPAFTRYNLSEDSIVDSLDIGTPLQINIPQTGYKQGITIFDKAWRDYLTDRYDKDTKVVSVKVNLEGFQVGVEMLRNFYAFDGCIWVLNKITNHSLTTNDLTECEFVKVQDMAKYKTGQKYGK